jgi:hypothetical protein
MPSARPSAPRRGRSSKTETYEERAKALFTREPANMKLLVVVDKLLTDFDAPPAPIRGPDVLRFLKHLLRHIPGKLLVIWDGAPIHCAQPVRDFLAAGGAALRPARPSIMRISIGDRPDTPEGSCECLPTGSV